MFVILLLTKRKEVVIVAKLKRKTTLKKDKVTPMFTVKDLEKIASEYDSISEQIKVLTERKKELSTKIKDGAEKLGVKGDKGSYYLDSDSYIMGKVASKSISIDQTKAVDFLKEKGLKKCVDRVVVETVNEEMLEKAVSSGLLSVSDVEQFTNTSVSYKVSVTKKEAMPEVEQTKLVAAKRK